MELTWYGRTCIRLRGRDAVVVNDPYPSIVGPTGRGITGDVVTFSHPDDNHPPKKATRLSRDGGTAMPTSLESAFVLDGPGEYEVHDVLLTGVRTYRDNDKGSQRGRQTAFVMELDGVHTIHLGDIGHELAEEKLADIGRVEVVCVPIGGALTAATAAALVAQLDPKIVIPMPVCEDEAACDEAV
jgi:L-ascorbate metabolism protein UlaG (beta-lactamase superfamily)